MNTHMQMLIREGHTYANGITNPPSSPQVVRAEASLLVTRTELGPNATCYRKKETRPLELKIFQILNIYPRSFNLTLSRSPHHLTF